MRVHKIPAVLFLSTGVLASCQGNSGTGQSDPIRYDPPNTQFATELGISAPPPVSRDQAAAIAAQAVGGTVIGVDQESEAGELLYEVQVLNSSGRMEVEVRASDGGVVEIEPAD